MLIHFGGFRKVDENFRHCKTELCEVETQVEKLQCEREVRVRELERAKFEWKEMKTDLDSKIERGDATSQSNKNNINLKSNSVTIYRCLRYEHLLVYRILLYCPAETVNLRTKYYF